MKKKIIIAAVCALGVWTILGVSYDFSQAPDKKESISDESAAMMVVVDKAKKRAAEISQKEALSHLCLSEGIELGKILQQTYPKLTAEQLKPDILRQGITDAITKTQNPVYPEKGYAYTLAATHVVAAKVGSPAPEPQGLSPEEQQLFDESKALSATISEDEAFTYLCYTLGSLAAEVLSRQIPLCSLDDLDLQAFVRGLTSTLKGEKLPIFDDKAECMAHGFALAWLIDARSAETGKRNQETGQAYLTANAAKEDVTTTASGLQYRVITPGTGPVYNKETHGEAPLCTITYEGRRANGSVFDSTGNTPVTFPIDKVVPGFSEALKMMPIGAEWEISIPPDLGYGATAPTAIGPNATLIFTVKLLSITPQPSHQNTRNPATN